MRTGKSLRQRLMLLLLGGLFAVAAAVYVESRYSALNAANETYDRSLLGAAIAISEQVLIVNGVVDVDIPYVALEMLDSAIENRVYYQVSLPDNSLVTGYDGLPLPPARSASEDLDQPVFYDSNYRGSPIRVAAISRFISSPEISTRVHIRVAESRDARNALFGNMIRDTLLRQAMPIAASALIMWVGITWGLRPLTRLQQALQRRHPKDLRPIRHKVPEEVEDVVQAVNDLMQRLDGSLKSMERFTANAAHQLRTPLAAIQTQSELAQNSKDPVAQQRHLGLLQESTRQSGHLIRQLLVLARASDAQNLTTVGQTDLVGLARSTTMDHVPKALEKGIDLGFESPFEALTIDGHPGLLSEALHNLIANAIAYCPPESVVTVRLGRQERQALLIVEDNGPGIDKDQTQSIFDRFERGDRQDVDGAGLGLSIVQEIVKAHGGRIMVTNMQPSGSRFIIHLPL